MSKRETFPYDAEEARLDVELTRQELGDTAQALADKAKDTAHTGRRIALAAGTALGAGALVLLIVRALRSGGARY